MKWCLMVQIAICIFTAKGAQSTASAAAPPTASSVDGNECLINVGSSSVGGSGTTSVPDTFTYVCKKDGNIAINISNLMSQGEFNIRGIEPSPKVLLPHCQNFTCTVTNKIVTVTPAISNCQHGLPILLEFDKLNSSSNGVAGGQSSKLFKLVCSSFGERKSYTVNPSAFSVTYKTPAVTYAPLGITMALQSGGKAITSTVVGEELTLGIQITDSAVNYKIKPTYCEATNGASVKAQIKTIKLWSEAKNSQSADPEIFEETWTKNSERNWSVNVFAFRFVDTDKLVITCNVRLCFIGGVDDGKGMCDESYSPQRRRRSISETDHVKNRRISKTIHVYDVQTSHSAGLTDLVSVAVISFILAGGRLLT